MATFISHPLFGITSSYILSKSQPVNQSSRFIFLSMMCQWIPDIDTLSYLFPIDEHHPLGHRGLTHSAVFAVTLAVAVMSIGYRSAKLSRAHWWGYYTWFFLMTLSHGLFDGLVASSLGVAYFWPFDSQRYQLAWQPLMDVPIQFSELFSSRFWYAQWVECQFLSCLLATLYLVYRMWQSQLQRPQTSTSPPIEVLTSKPYGSG